MTDAERPIREGYRFTGSEYVSEAWNILKKELGSFIGATVLLFVISFVVGLIPVIGLMNTFVQGALMAGFIIYARNMQSGTNKMSDFFDGFKYFVPITLYYIVFFLMIIPAFLIFIALAFPWEIMVELIGNVENAAEIGERLGMAMIGSMGKMFIVSLLFMAYAVYLGVSYALVIPLIVDGKMGFWQAMETSRKTVGKKFFSFLGFYILYGILAGLIILFTLMIGVLFIAPLAILVSFVMYDQIFKPYATEVDEIDAFGSNEGDINSEAQENPE